jgi:hypothetical protein
MRDKWSDFFILAFNIPCPFWSGSKAKEEEDITENTKGVFG